MTTNSKSTSKRQTRTTAPAFVGAWKRTRGGGFAIPGPVDIVTVGATVDVETRDGRRQRVEIDRVGQSFEDRETGAEMVYGYGRIVDGKDESKSSKPSGSKPSPDKVEDAKSAVAKSKGGWVRATICDDCEDLVRVGSTCAETGAAHR